MRPGRRSLSPNTRRHAVASGATRARSAIALSRRSRKNASSSARPAGASRRTVITDRVLRRPTPTLRPPAVSTSTASPSAGAPSRRAMSVRYTHRWPARMRASRSGWSTTAGWPRAIRGAGGRGWPGAGLEEAGLRRLFDAGLLVGAFEDVDFTEHSVVARANHDAPLAHATQPVHDPRAGVPCDFLERHVQEHAELTAELVHQPKVLFPHAARAGLRPKGLGDDLLERDEVSKRHAVLGAAARGAVRDRLHARHHTDCDRAPARGAPSLRRCRLLRRQPALARSVTVEMVLPFLREELDREQELGPVALAQDPQDLGVVHLAVKHVGFATELRGGVRVGVADQRDAVELREPPVHRRIAAEPRLRRGDVLGLVPEALRER